MTDSTPCRSFVRRLYPWEVDAARLVFAERLDYDRIRIHECHPWPDRINRLGMRLKGIKIDKKRVIHNAITLGNHCYFPVRLPEHPVEPEDREHYKLAWLIHEITHAWQYQQMGWRYLFSALSAQFRLKSSTYDYGGEEGLRSHISKGGRLRDFNLEQQGDITRDYYRRLVRDQDVSAWEPYIQEIRKLI